MIYQEFVSSYVFGIGLGLIYDIFLLDGIDFYLKVLKFFEIETKW